MNYEYVSTQHFLWIFAAELIDVEYFLIEIVYHVKFSIIIFLIISTKAYQLKYNFTHQKCFILYNLHDLPF